MLLLRRCPIIVALAVLALTGVARSQFLPGGPGGGGPGGDFMSKLLEQVAFGAVEDVNPIDGYLQVGVPGRESRIVVIGPTTRITRMAEVPPSELKPGDEVTVSGAPTVLVADKVRLGEPLGMADVMAATQGSAQPPAPSAPGPSGQPAAQRTPLSSAPPTMAPPPTPPSAPLSPTGSFTLTGKVKSVTPLVVVAADGVEVTVIVPPGRAVLRRTDGDLSAAVVGVEVVAFGAPDADGYLAATEVHFGESISLGRMSSGMGMGGFPGARRGGEGSATPPTVPTVPPTSRPEGGKHD